MERTRVRRALEPLELVLGLPRRPLDADDDGRVPEHEFDLLAKYVSFVVVVDQSEREDQAGVCAAVAMPAHEVENPARYGAADFVPVDRSWEIGRVRARGAAVREVVRVEVDEQEIGRVERRRVWWRGELRESEGDDGLERELRGRVRGVRPVLRASVVSWEFVLTFEAGSGEGAHVGVQPLRQLHPVRLTHATLVRERRLEHGSVVEPLRV